MSRQNIYEIEADVIELASVIDRLGEEGADEALIQAVESYFGEKLEERDAKIDGYCAYIRTLEARSQARTEEAERIKALAAIDENAAKRLRERLKAFFESKGIQKFETLRNKLWIQASGGKRAVELSVEPDQVPDEYTTLIPASRVPNNDAIRAALLDGANLDFARLKERGSSLRIK